MWSTVSKAFLRSRKSTPMYHITIYVWYQSLVASREAFWEACPGLNSDWVSDKRSYIIRNYYFANNRQNRVWPVVVRITFHPFFVYGRDYGQFPFVWEYGQLVIDKLIVRALILVVSLVFSNDKLYVFPRNLNIFLIGSDILLAFLISVFVWLWMCVGVYALYLTVAKSLL